jgi:hypothetical protein
MCFSRCAIGNQTQAIAVATAARTPQIIPAAAPKTRSIPTITIGLTSPPNAKLSTATIPAPTTTPIPARIEIPLGVFMRTTLHYKVHPSQAPLHGLLKRKIFRAVVHAVFSGSASTSGKSFLTTFRGVHCTSRVIMSPNLFVALRSSSNSSAVSGGFSRFFSGKRLIRSHGLSSRKFHRTASENM